MMKETGQVPSGPEARKPNVYKGMLGLMDLSYKEFADVAGRNIPSGLDASEICRAVRGKEGARHDLIRRLIAEEFLSWIGSVK